MGITLHLFGKPAWHLEEGAPVPPGKLRETGDKIRERCHTVAGIVEKLTAAGWDLALTLYSIDGYHPVYKREEEIMAHLAELGISKDDVGIDDFLDEEDEADFDDDPGDEFGDDEDDDD